MKENTHPNYREVVFQDVSNGFTFVTRSTIQTRETIDFEGKSYPLAKIEVSSESHPFYTGQQKIMDTAGRVEKFNKKFGARAAGKAAAKYVAAPLYERAKVLQEKGQPALPFFHRHADRPAAWRHAPHERGYNADSLRWRSPPPLAE